MKAALITEEQIKAIQDALMELMYSSSTEAAMSKSSQAILTLASLKVQEPVGYKLKKPYSDIFTDRQVEGYELVNWTPLYALGDEK